MKKVITIAALAIGMFASAQEKTFVSFQTNSDNVYNLDLTTDVGNYIVGFGSGYTTKENFGYAYVNLGKDVNKTFAYAVRTGMHLQDQKELSISLYLGATAYLRLTDKLQLALTQDNKNRTLIGVGYRF